MWGRRDIYSFHPSFSSYLVSISSVPRRDPEPWEGAVKMQEFVLLESFLPSCVCVCVCVCVFKGGIENKQDE